MKTKSELFKSVMRAIKPVKKMSVSEWADEYRILSQGAAEPGKWKTRSHQKAIMDAFTQVGIKRVVVKSCSQIGKTDIMNCVLGRFAQLDPCNILIIEPTLEMAADLSKSRIMPMIRDTKVLTSLFYEKEKTRDSNQTILSKFFSGGRLVLAGANSPAGLASRPIRILLCDEVDRFAESAGGEGDPLDLASKRQSTYWNAITGIFSTPTKEGFSRIDVEYLAGTQEEWQHICPNCKEYHVLDYRQMRVDYTEQKDEAGNKTVIVKSVKWQCPDCGFEFTEIEMKRAAQKYVAQNPVALENGVRSFSLNGFSSPWLSWNLIMREWLEAKGSPNREAVVYNTRFGLSYKFTGEYEDEKQFADRREDYGAEVPEKVCILTAAVDVQKNRLEYEICGWGAGEVRFGIKRGTVMGEPTDKNTWRALDEILNREYLFADGTGIKITRAFIDSGYSTQAVYSYCAANIQRQRIAIKGKGGAGMPLLYQYSSMKDTAIPIIILGVDDGKQEIYSRLGITDENHEQYMHYPKPDGYLWRGYDDSYFKQLISERQITRVVNGIVKTGWQPVTRGARNEALDLAVYNLACLKSCIGKTDEKIFWRRCSESKIKPKKKSPAQISRSLNIWN